jgi:hypothetical protein
MSVWFNLLVINNILGHLGKMNLTVLQRQDSLSLPLCVWICFCSGYRTSLIVDQDHNMESMTWFMLGRIIRWLARNKHCDKTIQEIAARAQEKEIAA